MLLSVGPTALNKNPLRVINPLILILESTQIDDFYHVKTGGLKELDIRGSLMKSMPNESIKLRSLNKLTLRQDQFIEVPEMPNTLILDIRPQ